MKRGGYLSFLVGTISNVLVMEIGWTDVGSGRYILVSCAHSNTSLTLNTIGMYHKSYFPETTNEQSQNVWKMFYGTE